MTKPQFTADKTETKASGYWGTPRWPVWVGLAPDSLSCLDQPEVTHILTSTSLAWLPTPGMPSWLWSLALGPGTLYCETGRVHQSPCCWVCSGLRALPMRGVGRRQIRSASPDPHSKRDRWKERREREMETEAGILIEGGLSGQREREKQRDRPRGPRDMLRCGAAQHRSLTCSLGFSRWFDRRSSVRPPRRGCCCGCETRA